MMANAPLSTHFFYFLAKHEVPDDYKPILQVVQARPTKNGFRFKMFDGFFCSSACYLHNADLIDKLPNFTTHTPKVRVKAYDLQHTDRVIFNITAMDVLDVNCDSKTLNLNYPVNETTTAYDEFMAGKTLAEEVPDYEVKPAKRARIESNPTPNPSAILTAYKSPPKNPAFANRAQGNHQASGDQNITPFSLITPFINRWRICGFCSHKLVKDVNSAVKGPMRVLEFQLSDEHGKTLKITAWNDQADEINAIVNESQMYYVTGDQGCIKKKNTRFNYTDCDYEITLNQSCQVTVCTDRVYQPPKFTIRRKLLADIQPTDDTVDIMAVIDKIGEKTRVMVKTKGEEVAKRDYLLVDESATSISLTVWDEKAEEPICEEGQIIAIKTARVKEFNGSASLALTVQSSVEINPELSGAEPLYDWYNNVKPTIDIKSLSTAGSNANFLADLRSLGAVKNTRMTDSVANGVYFYAKAEILEIRKDNVMYPACDQCNKKVVSYEGGLRCDKCNINNAPHKMRYMLNVLLSDELDTVYVTLFDEQATSLLGISAQELDQYQQQDQAKFESFFTPLLFQSVIVRMRAKNDYYNDQTRQKFTVYNVKPVPLQQYDMALDAVLAKLENL
jgi:replication factor A1